jgi:hypothetical protein
MFIKKISHLLKYSATKVAKAQNTVRGENSLERPSGNQLFEFIEREIVPFIPASSA